MQQKKFNLFLTEKERNDIKILAAKKEITMNDLILEAIKDKLEEKTK